MIAAKKYLSMLFFVFVVGMVFPTANAVAQCAMCTLNAENSTKEGNTQGKGLNDGILFLLSMPFIIGAGIGVLWYTKFRVAPETRSSGIRKSD